MAGVQAPALLVMLNVQATGTEIKPASTVSTSFLAGFNGFTVTASLRPVVGLKSESLVSSEGVFCLVEMVQPAGKVLTILTW